MERTKQEHELALGNILKADRLDKELAFTNSKYAQMAYDDMVRTLDIYYEALSEILDASDRLEAAGIAREAINKGER